MTSRLDPGNCADAPVKPGHDRARIKDEQLNGSSNFAANDTRNALAAVEEQLKVLLKLQGRSELSFINVSLRGVRVENMLDSNSRMPAWWDFFTDLVGVLPAQDAVGAGGAEADRGTGGVSNIGLRDLTSLGNATEFLGALAETENALSKSGPRSK